MANILDVFASSVGKSVGASVGKVAEGTPSPADLYSEAAPRVVRALKQYDDAAPLIDATTKFWWLMIPAAFAIGVAAAYLGNYLYDKRRRRP